MLFLEVICELQAINLINASVFELLSMLVTVCLHLYVTKWTHAVVSHEQPRIHCN